MRIFWHGWGRWVFGFEYFPRDGRAWLNRARIMIGPADIGLLVMLWLVAGCANQPIVGPTSQIGQFTAADLSSAEAIAKVAQEPIGGGCWAYLGQVVAALPASPGVATLAELKLLAGSSAFLGVCGQVLPTLLQKPLVLP